MKKEERNSRNVSRGRHCNSIASILDILYIGVVIILLIHLIALQIFDPHRYRERGKMRRASHDFELRGDIYDRNGIKLATDRIYYNIYARPVDYTKNETPAKIAKLFSPVLGMPEQTLYKKLSDKSIKVISLKKNVDRDTEQKLMKIISKNNFRSISLDKKDERDYPQGVLHLMFWGFTTMKQTYQAGLNILQEINLNM